MRPTERKASCSFCRVSALLVGLRSLRGKAEGERYSRTETSTLWTLCSSGRVRPAIRALEPRRVILRR